MAVRLRLVVDLLIDRFYFAFHFLWARYTNALATRPLVTKSVTSGVLAVAGDGIAQQLEGHKHDWERTGRFAIWGTFIMGPVLHNWYKGLERIFPGQTLLQSAKKIVLEQTTFAVAIIPAFMGTMGAMSGQPWSETEERLRQVWWPTLLMNWKVWPVANFINFQFVPLQQRVAFASAVNLAWNVYLSWQAHKALPVDGKAPPRHH